MRCDDQATVHCHTCIDHHSRENALITAAQLRAARALVGMDQRALAHAARLSLPTIQRMEASEGIIRGTVDSLMKLITALKAAGVELINEGDTSAPGGRGVRLLDAAVKRGRMPRRSRPQNARMAVVLPGRRRST
jgi:transcriptional regulator with XRE-family HTH domain